MSRRTFALRQVIEILRLKNQHHLSVREIARSCILAPGTVWDYLRSAESAQLGWPLPEGHSQQEVERRLHDSGPPAGGRVIPDGRQVQEELRRPNVTLRLLWQEYPRAEPAGLKCSRYCERYRLWC